MRRRAILIFLGAFLVIICDQVSKYLVVKHLTLNESWYPFPFLKPLFALTYIHNTGAAFGLLQNQNLFFSVVAIVVIIVIVYYVRTEQKLDPVIALALALQLGGATGNLIDRLRQGYVVDFLHLNFWAISNVADICISTGVVLLAYTLIFRMPSAQTADG